MVRRTSCLNLLSGSWQVRLRLAKGPPALFPRKKERKKEQLSNYIYPRCHSTRQVALKDRPSASLLPLVSREWSIPVSLGVPSIPILSRDPNLSRKPPESQGKRRSVFEKNFWVEKNGQGINPYTGTNPHTVFTLNGNQPSPTRSLESTPGVSQASNGSPSCPSAPPWPRNLPWPRWGKPNATVRSA